MPFPKFSSIFLWLLIYTCLPAAAQKETANWYFGKFSGWNFPNRTANGALLTNGKIEALEGCTAISDSLGNLLFYTAGDVVYNKDHAIMNNGLPLTGHQSASQSSLVVKQPHSSGVYYLFTLDALGEANGLRYSKINTNALQGKGTVLTKNISLLTPVSEKITAVDHRLTQDTWVIVHGSGPQNDAFYAYLVTKNGINPPVISQVGASHQRAKTLPFGPNMNTVGCMKASPDGTMLALALTAKDSVQVFNFNDITGKVSNPITLNQLPDPYGVEFSPDSKKLYYNTETINTGFYQVNLEAGKGHQDSVKATQIQIGVAPNVFAGTLQQALNGRIYIASAGDSALHAIVDPDNLTAPQLGLNQAKLYGNGATTIPKRRSQQGLPNFNQSYFYKPYFKARYVCHGDVTQFTLTDTARYTSVTWNFGEPQSGAANTATGNSPAHRYAQPGTYTVTVSVVLLNGKARENSRTVAIYPLPTANLGPDREICPGDSFKLGGSVFNSTSITRSFLWSTGETSDSIVVSKPGIYWLETKSLANCTKRDSMVVKFKQAPVFFNEPILGLCAGTETELKTDLPAGTPLTWFNGSAETSVFVKEEGFYKVTAKLNGCFFTDSVKVVYRDCPELYLVPNVITPNGDNRNDKFLLRGVLPGTWKLQVYNRWGTLLYETENYRNEWPVKTPADGAYFYRLINGNGAKQQGWLQVVH